MEHVFLIERIWTAPFENQVDSAVGYEPIGWVATEEEAEKFEQNCKTLTKKDCWAIWLPMKEYKYRKLVKLKTDEHIQMVEEEEKGTEDKKSADSSGCESY